MVTLPPVHMDRYGDFTTCPHGGTVTLPPVHMERYGDFTHLSTWIGMVTVPTCPHEEV